jgi:hypothetical protein
MSAASVANDQATCSAQIDKISAIVEGWITQYSLPTGGSADANANGAQFIKDGGVGKLPSQLEGLLRRINAVAHG